MCNIEISINVTNYKANVFTFTLLLSLMEAISFIYKDGWLLSVVFKYWGRCLTDKAGNMTLYRYSTVGVRETDGGLATSVASCPLLSGQRSKCTFIKWVLRLPINITYILLLKILKIQLYSSPLCFFKLTRNA